MGFKLEHFLEQPRLQLIMLCYQFNVFSNVQPEVSADIPSQFFSEIGIRSNLERAEIDYHDIKVANDTASTATATGFAATEDGVLRGMEVFL